MHAVLRAYREAASVAVEPDLLAYFEGGSGEQITLDEAERSWQRYRLRPRVLRDVSVVDTTCHLLRAPLATPILVAPTASHGLLHADGELATARGTAAAGSLLVVSTRASRPLEAIAEAAGPWWFQVYVTRDGSITDELVKRAVGCGAGALVLTGDTPFVGRKQFDRPVPVGSAGEQSPAVTPADVGRLAELSGLPVLVKGVLRADDALACLRAGAAGLIVSNHGGRQLDRAVSTADALAEVVAAVDGAPVLVDGGIRSGTDALIALAIGATAVLVGRPALWGLAADGTNGVQSVLSALTDDLAHVMALAGTTALSDLDASLVADVVRSS